MKKSALFLAAGVVCSGLGYAQVIQPAKTEPAKAEANQTSGQAQEAGVKDFTVVGVEYQGSKLWIPGTLVVKKGQKVRIKLVNNIVSEPSTHGYAIDEFGVKTVVARGKPETVEFTADKEGVFTIYCQQHPAHIGGQLLVIK